MIGHVIKKMDPEVLALLQLLGGIPNVTITQSGNSLIDANNPINTLTSTINPAPSQARSGVRPQAAVATSQHQASHTSGSQSQLSSASRLTGTATTST